MAVQKKFALGRGLDALISTEEVKTAGSSSINEIELSKISVNPNQPRREFDPVALQELADSIAEIGIIQPITLRQLSEDSYQIIAGERRYRASIQAGLKSIPAYIRTADDENDVGTYTDNMKKLVKEFQTSFVKYTKGDLNRDNDLTEADRKSVV